MKGQWTNIKPDGKKECVFATASYYGKRWDYNIWQIMKVDGIDGWYLGLCNGDGEEWGDLNDLQADLYMILPNHKR